MTSTDLYLSYLNTARDIAQGVVCMNDAGRLTLADEIAYAIDEAVKKATRGFEPVEWTGKLDPQQERRVLYECPEAVLERRHLEAFGPLTDDMRVWDLYAAHALGGVLASPLRQYLNSGEIARSVAKDADALLAERRRRMGQAGASSDNVSTGTAGGKDV